jgi:hypothetical protein
VRVTKTLAAGEIRTRTTFLFFIFFHFYSLYFVHFYSQVKKILAAEAMDPSAADELGMTPLRYAAFLLCCCFTALLLLHWYIYA